MIEKDETDEIFHPDLYDISDVKFEMSQAKRSKTILLIAKADTPFNLVKYYLSLKAYVEGIEAELNILESAEGEH